MLNVDDEFIKWFMTLDDNSLWDTVVHNVHNLMVAHLVFLTNRHNLIQKMMESMENTQQMNIINKKDTHSNTVVH
jgi:hypothetical protein